MTTQAAFVMAPLLPWIRTGVVNMGESRGGGRKQGDIGKKVNTDHLK